jgi:choline dehydrogenase-like flavoprotein
LHIDAKTLDDGSHFETDLCIVGAGAAGITVARELRNARIKILLVESGGLDPDPGSQALDEGESVGFHYPFPLSAARLRYFGGTTGHWAGLCAPLDPIDFEKREWIQFSGWPITYDDLEPWYRRAQEICQLGVFEYGLKYWEKQTGLRPLPLSPQVISTKILQLSPPTRFGQAYRDDVVQANNITLWTFANVTDIQSNPEASHVTGLEVRTLNLKKLIVRARRYILSCGGLENPRVLLIANKVVRQGLGNQHDLVGRFFFDHPHVDTSKLLLPKNTKLDFYQAGFVGPQRILTLFGITPAIQRARGIANYSSLIWPKPLDSTSDGLVWQLNTRLEQVPNPSSRVILNPTKRDALGQPELRLNWELTALDRDTIRVAEGLIAGELGRTGVGRLQIPDWLEKTDGSWPADLQCGPHHMGTTRMGASANAGVVDSDCKVHGIENLYVAGSSVFPTGGTANPTMTIVALAARLANHLRGMVWV